MLLWQEGAEQLVWIFRGNEPIWGVIFRIIEDHHGVLVNPGMRDQECGRIELRAQCVMARRLWNGNRTRDNLIG